MTTVEDISDRLARLEESQKHLATKADVEALRGELRSDLAQMEGRLAWRLSGRCWRLLWRSSALWASSFSSSSSSQSPVVVLTKAVGAWVFTAVWPSAVHAHPAPIVARQARGRTATVSGRGRLWVFEPYSTAGGSRLNIRLYWPDWSVLMTTVEDISDRLARLEESQKHLATKADVEAIRGELRADVEALRGELRSDLAQMEGRLAWRLSGAMLAIIVALIGLMGVVIFQQF